MTELDMTGPRRRTRTILGFWLLLATVATTIIAANAHLIYVATTSQPECVAHVRQGEGSAIRRHFSAAQSSCSPPITRNPS